MGVTTRRVLAIGDFCEHGKEPLSCTLTVTATVAAL
jgi:hypothetical protein